MRRLSDKNEVDSVMKVIFLRFGLYSVNRQELAGDR